MTGPSPDSGRFTPASAVLLVATSITGIVLPIDFLSQVDGYLMFLRPWELVPIWGWAWVFCAFLGLLSGTLATLFAIGAARIARQDSATFAAGVGNWLSLSMISLALLKGVKIWMERFDFGGAALWLSTHRDGPILFILAGFALFVCRRLIGRSG